MPSLEKQNFDHDPPEDAMRELDRDGKAGEAKEKAKSKTAAKGIFSSLILLFYITALINLMCRQGPLPCPLQIFQSWLLHCWLGMSILPQHPRTRSTEGSLRMVCKGKLQVRP